MCLCICPTLPVEWPSNINISERQCDLELVFDDDVQAIVFKLKFSS